MELNNLLKTFGKAPGFWPEYIYIYIYLVDFHGDASMFCLLYFVLCVYCIFCVTKFHKIAGTFPVAQKRLLKLKNNEYAFTSDGRGPEKVEETKSKFREKKLSVRPEEEEKLFDVPSIAEELHQLPSSDESIFSLSKMNLEKNINNSSKIKSTQASKKPKRTRKAGKQNTGK